MPHSETQGNCSVGDPMLTRCRIVLVRPHFAGNLGSVARSMRNFGLTDLVLVAPYTFPTNPEARRMATLGLDVLDAARIVPELAEAIGDCVCAVGTSALTGGLIRQGVKAAVGEKLPELFALAASGTVAIVFGPEPHGLSNAEIAQCQGLIHIPVDPEHSSLNLAQAVTICCYEWRNAWANARATERNEPAHGAPKTISPVQDQERMFGHLRAALEAIHYLYGTKADPLMHSIRQLIGRAQPTPQEVRMLHGLARQILYVASVEKPEFNEQNEEAE